MTTSSDDTNLRAMSEFRGMGTRRRAQQNASTGCTYA